jgi:hypothetical protein
LLVIALEEKATLVAEYPWFEDEYLREVGTFLSASTAGRVA